MIQRVKITELKEFTSKPDAPKAWRKLGIKTDKHGDKWLGAFINQYSEKGLAKLAAGQTLDLVITTSDDGKYLNFSIPTRTDKLEARMTVVEQKLGITDEQVPSSDDINPDDIPF